MAPPLGWMWFLAIGVTLAGLYTFALAARGLVKGFLLRSVILASPSGRGLRVVGVTVYLILLSCSVSLVYFLGTECLVRFQSIAVAGNQVALRDYAGLTVAKFGKGDLRTVRRVRDGKKTGYEELTTADGKSYRSVRFPNAVSEDALLGILGAGRSH